jgi:hypothetical protein
LYPDQISLNGWSFDGGVTGVVIPSPELAAMDTPANPNMIVAVAPIRTFVIFIVSSLTFGL